MKFLVSKTFFIQLVLAAVVTLLIVFITLEWLESSTNQDQRIEVPDLSRLTLEEVDQRLEALDLRREVLDSASYNPDYPPYSVIEQAPVAGSFVKEKRKIYLTLNPSGYRRITIPEGLIRGTLREVEPALRSLGFEVGDITYKPDVARDVVLELRHKGEELEPGDELMKTSVIDLVLGDGSGRYEPAEMPEETSVEETEPIDEL